MAQMKVTYDGVEYAILFAYWGIERFDRRSAGRLVQCTQCAIVDPRRQPKGLPLIGFAAATITCHYQDTPNRKLARKIALTRALAELDKVHPVAEGQDPKLRRRLFWRAYLERGVRTAAAG